MLSMGSTLANAAMLEGKHVTYLPAYGVEVRGGTANCTVIVSDEEIASPVASAPEFVVAMNQPSFARFQSILQAGGLLLANSSLVNTDSARSDIEILADPHQRTGGKARHRQGCQHGHARGPGPGEQHGLLRRHA